MTPRQALRQTLAVDPVPSAASTPLSTPGPVLLGLVGQFPAVDQLHGTRTPS
ncbi:hypothetical protein [Microbispora siamensis]|uniref:hypothetical protein n=1 Tax=Microbispora siamensis TaxID=564413 RepID=UPI00194F93B2|nr:hypothetical protein [Microbispora siamensis]